MTTKSRLRRPCSLTGKQTVTEWLCQLFFVVSVTALATGCGGAGGLSQEDMAQYALRRPKTDDATPPAIGANLNQQSTNTVVADENGSLKQSPKESSRNTTKKNTQFNHIVPSANGAEAAATIDQANTIDVTAAPSDDMSGELSDTIAPPTNRLGVVERRRRTLSNITKISAALEAYREQHGRYPLQAIFGQSKQPLLSWRVELLPLLGYQSLYDKFRKSEPWNSINNRPLLDLIPSVYQSPRRYDNQTNYLLPVGSSCAFFGNRAKVPRRWDDGMTNVAVLLEVDDTHAVPWSAPDDLAVDLREPKVGLGGLYADGFFMAWGGGQVARIPATVSAANLKAMFTVDGGEPFSSGTISLAAVAEQEGANQNDTNTVATAGASATFDDTRNRVLLASKPRRSPASIVSNTPLEPIDDLMERTRFAFASQQEAEGIQLAYISILAGKINASTSYYWVPGLRRPAAFLRYGIAIDYSGSDHGEVDVVNDDELSWQPKKATFVRVAGELAEAVIDRLQRSRPIMPDAVIEDRQGTSDRRLQVNVVNNIVCPGVECLGAGGIGTVARLADLREVDVLILFSVQDRKVSRGNAVNKHVSLKCIDVANRKSLYESATISYAHRANTRTVDLLYKDPVDSTLAAIDRLIEAKLTPKPLPRALRARHAAARVETLVRGRQLNKLRSAAEVNLYHELELLSMKQTLDAYNVLIGEEAGLTLLAGDLHQRAKVLANLQPRIVLPLPTRRSSDDD